MNLCLILEVLDTMRIERFNFRSHFLFLSDIPDPRYSFWSKAGLSAINFPLNRPVFYSWLSTLTQHFAPSLFDFKLSFLLREQSS